MTYPATPKRGMTFVKVCIHCDQTQEMIVSKVRKKNQNTDGSFCYTLEMDLSLIHISEPTRPY